MSRPTAYEYLVSVVMGDDTKECMLWPFYTNRQGYGTLTVLYSNGKRGPVFAHRLAYKIAYGEWPMPKGLHRCDNPRCFNPRHIFPGTIKDNATDMVAKGRQAKGERNPRSKLTCELVKKMRREYAGGLTSTQLSVQYGISVYGVCAALAGRTWKHVSDPVNLRIWKKPLSSHCIHGHPFVEGSFYATLLTNGIIHRKCKQCDKDRHEYRKLSRVLGGRSDVRN